MNRSMTLVKGVKCSQAYILVEGFCQSQGADVSLSNFSAFLNLRRCKKLENLLKNLTLGRPVLQVFLCALSASFLIAILNSFQCVLKSLQWQVTIFFFFFFGYTMYLVGSSSTRDQTRAPALKAPSPNHQTTTEFPLVTSFFQNQRASDSFQLAFYYCDFGRKTIIGISLFRFWGQDQSQELASASWPMKAGLEHEASLCNLVGFLIFHPLMCPTYSGMAQLVNHKAPLDISYMVPA